jgi:hypothetical protein
MRWPAATWLSTWISLAPWFVSTTWSCVAVSDADIARVGAAGWALPWPELPVIGPSFPFTERVHAAAIANASAIRAARRVVTVPPAGTAPAS